MAPVLAVDADTVTITSRAQEPPLTAKWIWRAQGETNPYNQTIVARKSFTLEEPKQATLRITADSFYRLFVNGHWVNDGPSRAWPEHFQYDVLDVTPYLVAGNNEIRVIARYYGVGDFHRVPRRAGLIAQLNAQLRNGGAVTLGTDGSWETAIAPAWQVNTPKVSIQMEPCELYDARREASLDFSPAAVLCGAHDGPWRGLSPRDSALLTRQPFPFKNFLGAKVVRADAMNFCLPAACLVHPGLIEANHNTSMACGMATVLVADKEVALNIQTEGLRVAIDGQQAKQNQFKLAPGRHFVVALVGEIFGHEKEKALRFMNPKDFRLENPTQAGYENPWLLIRFPEFAVATNDLMWMNYAKDDPRLAAAMNGYAKARDALLSSVKDDASFNQHLGDRWAKTEKRWMFVEDTFWQFTQRRVIGDATSLVQNPSGLMHDNAEMTTIQPSADGDVELLYDLGEQNCGYYQFDLVANAGVQVDIFGIEYIAPDGRLQFSWGNRNGMRYITKEGVNRFTSLKRRSGRYVFLTLRNQKSPVRIRHFNLIESTYPVSYTGGFSCSDARLDRIWDISTRTLKLCMEDTYTDCPLYEQTHWVGDARNESLLAYGVFGAHDLARRCIDITAQSLEHYPIGGCQTPSCWDVMLPAWSFLWGISTWDYYWETGDKEFLRGIYPAVIRNLKGAEKYIDQRGLFTAPFWNFFDWVNIDQNQRTVLHNSLFVVGAIDAALKEAEVLGDSRDVAWLKAFRARVTQGINALWDPAKQSYPDSIRDDGSVSPSTCQHTSFLSLLYDVIPTNHAAAAINNLTNPPAKMVRIGSPFAVLYLYETFEKLGLEDLIVGDIYKNYLPMVESGATTVWESFPTGTTGGGGFPTRSHCHAWSSAPSRFLNRIILGVKETAPGGSAVQISPRLSGLTWARGTVATVRGPVSVSWKLEGNTLDVRYSAPDGTKVNFARNDSLAGRNIVLNGTKAE